MVVWLIDLFFDLGSLYLDVPSGPCQAGDGALDRQQGTSSGRSGISAAVIRRLRGASIASTRSAARHFAAGSLADAEGRVARTPALKEARMNNVVRNYTDAHIVRPSSWRTCDIPPMSAGPQETGHPSNQEEPLSVENQHRWWKEAGGWQLRELLYWRWDPIGVSGGFPFTREEYDGYAGRLEKLLTGGAGPDELSAYLLEAERHMGLILSHGTETRRAKMAELILTWHRNSLSHWQSQIR